MMKITLSITTRETLNQEINNTSIRKTEKAVGDSEAAQRLMTAEAAANPRLWGQREEVGFQEPRGPVTCWRLRHSGLCGGSRNLGGEETIDANREKERETTSLLPFSFLQTPPSTAQRLNLVMSRGPWHPGNTAPDENSLRYTAEQGGEDWVW